jgi:hypothetical protein
MARWLRQSTSVDVPIGPFVDQTDGFTAETALTLTQPDIRLKKNGAAWAQKAAAQTLSHEENGYYEVTLDATDTNTLGLLRLAVNESGALPVFEDFLVVPANIYDSFFSTDFLQVDVAQWLGTNAATPTVPGVPEVDLTHLVGVAQSANDLKDFADDGYDPATNKVQGVVLTDTLTTYTGDTPQTGDSFARIGATGSGLTSILNRLPASLIGGKIDALTSIRSGTAQQGSASVIRLDASASSTTDFYKRNVVLILSGTGALQPIVRITAYNGSTKDATVAPNFLVNPDGTSVFVILPASLLTMYLGAR